MQTKSNLESAADVRAVILAGGSGSRLWPLSRQQFPKQFLSLDGGASLLEATIARLQPLIGPESVVIVTGEEYAKGEAYRALLPYQTILEPVARNTAPAIAVAAAWLSTQADDPVMVVLPADHVIRNVEAFRKHLAVAVEAARAGRLVTFGITPQRPDSGFGYLHAKPAAPGAVLLEVERFTEKPDVETARGFLQEGGYYWNSGMFVWRASVILKEIERHLPEVHRVLSEMRAEWDAGADFPGVMKRHFHRMPSVSIDYGVLEKSANVALVPCDIGWSDVGTWDAFFDIAEKDEGGNSIRGNVLTLGCKNALVLGGKRLVAAVGVEDLCIVETADAILVMRRGQSQRVREVVETLATNHAKEHLTHVTVNRPWGRYTVLEDEECGYKIKRIEVDPGGRLSLQRHQHRSEHWVVVSGTATIERDGKVLTVAKNESAYIPIGVRHRLENRGKIPLQLIEVQVGEYVGEDDIERFDDSYGRMDA